ncbi:hypothetical protein SODALDRAFT_57753 [Sodiomyces alkalinus F11]|uniref:Secreted protein n=1 Tax=Sodiomyces alkalinus (strain CBS 110278 / VKM F-3762 / F11) TaxID=1314773 RepID=A0A3N2PNJ9_SODAK|nr:hypothetical protein SODALDRAFT_57753 [Sodiomyces alkalinus F11]ROT36095.1 hypothetical protein SODALDRAFT_57753 [Sodiomyces alkalinus F11]
MWYFVSPSLFLQGVFGCPSVLVSSARDCTLKRVQRCSGRYTELLGRETGRLTGPPTKTGQGPPPPVVGATVQAGTSRVPSALGPTSSALPPAFVSSCAEKKRVRCGKGGAGPRWDRAPDGGD